LRDRATVNYGVVAPVSGVAEEATVVQLDD
jgi:hypothetical protein